MKNMTMNGKWLFVQDSEQKLEYADIKSCIDKDELNDEMILPANWETYGLHNFNGSVWFVKTIKLHEDVSDLCLLKYHGSDYFTEVWLNDEFIGSHEGYFQTFIFNVSGKLQKGKDNIFVVKVTSPREIPGKVWPLKKQLIKGIFNHHDCRPGACNLEYGQNGNTGGIWNDIELNYNDEIYFEYIKVNPVLINNGAVARTFVKLSYHNSFNVQKDLQIEVLIRLNNKTALKKKINVKIKPSAGEAEFVVDITNPALWYSWDTGKQNLYQLSIKTNSGTEITESFGIRKVELDSASNFYLNGKKLFLRGTNIIPEQYLSILTNDRIKKLAALIKEANINIVRVHAHVNRKELYEEFDRVGILVWQDFALQWTYEESEKFVANATSQIRDMVKHLFNHPSIAFWCCHNEPGKQIETVDPFLYNAVLSEDNSRVIRLASNYEEHPYEGWYWGNMEQFAATPMGPIVTEFGAQAIPNINTMKKMFPGIKNEYDWKNWAYHNFQYDQTFNIAKIEKGNSLEEFIGYSQKYQSQLIKTAINYYRRKKNNGITGIFQFMLIDCWPSITWSVVDYYGEKKEGYYALQKAYSPVYLSVFMRQSQYTQGSKLNVDFNIINDLQTEYKKCSIVFLINDRKIGDIKNIRILPDSNQFIHFESITVTLPDKYKSGNYLLKIKLINMDDKKTLFEDINEIVINTKPEIL